MSTQASSTSAQNDEPTRRFARRVVALCQQTRPDGSPRFSEAEVETFFLMAMSLAGLVEPETLSPRLQRRLALLAHEPGAPSVPAELLEGLATIIAEVTPSGSERADASRRLLGTDLPAHTRAATSSGERRTALDVRLAGLRQT